MMRPIFLVGYMGCGKTTLGTVLARHMGLRYIDLDEFVEKQCGMTVVGIFETMGQNRFRELETAALRQVAAMTGVIVGCGGGTPCHSGNMDVMNEAGITVWLTTSPERITARLLLPEQKRKRPKVNTLDDADVLPLVKKELQARSCYYGKARVQFDSTDIETALATERTARRLADLLQRM